MGVTAAPRSAGTRHRTQLYLDDRLYRLLGAAARRRRVSRAALVREALQRFLQEQTPADDDPFLALGEAGTETGIKDGSSDIDKYLYRGRRTR